MGREWYWGGSKSSNSKRGGEKGTSHSTTTSTAHPSGCMSAVFQFFDFHHFQIPLHPHQSSFKPPTNSCLPEDHTILKGVEAPRNSLDLEETPLSSTSLLKEEEGNLNIPMGIQIRTSCGHPRSKLGSASNDSSSEISSSPGAKTPNLVARLMGLDLLPESHSPSFSSCHETPNPAPKSNLHHHFRPRQSLQGKPVGHRNSIDVDVTGTRSLPETPRISSARRSDVDHHRLSLQINKENVGVGEELDFTRFSYLRRRDLKQEDEYGSASHYARQIVKQVKESVSRKVGFDITNTLRNRERARDRDELVSSLKTKRSSTVLSKVVDQSSPVKHSAPSCSSRLSRFLDSKQKPVTSTSTTVTKDNIPHQPRKSSSSSAPPQALIQPQPIKVSSTKSKLQPVLQEQEQHHHDRDQQRPTKKCRKTKAGERFSPRLKKPPQTTDIIRNKQEPFVRASTANRANSPDKKCKKTPLSNDLLNITVPTLLPVKKGPSPPATKVPQKQVLNAQSSKSDTQLSSNSSQTYKQEATHALVARDNIDDRPNGVTATTKGGAEYEYVTRILRRTGIDKDTPVFFAKWFSPAHPLDPSIFQNLENTNPTPMIISSSSSSSQLTHHCNRKLLFELVNEILVDILKPCVKMKPWIIIEARDCHGYGHILQGSELIDTLCMQIKSFPLADCRVLEDIDALIDKELPQMKFQREMAFEEEGEGLVSEIEKDILDTLIQETAVEFGAGRTAAFW